jgi:hypothetical protein
LPQTLNVFGKYTTEITIALHAALNASSIPAPDLPSLTNIASKYLKEHFFDYVSMRVLRVFLQHNCISI